MTFCLDFMMFNQSEGLDLVKNFVDLKKKKKKSFLKLSAKI